jgi:hypothetical protein
MRTYAPYSRAAAVATVAAVLDVIYAAAPTKKRSGQGGLALRPYEAHSTRRPDRLLLQAVLRKYSIRDELTALRDPRRAVS